MKQWSWGVCVLALLAAACGGTPGTAVREGAGVLEIPLTSQSMDGAVYRLVGATFTITGPETVTVTDTSMDTVSVPLTPGAYAVELGGSWHVERMDAPGQAVAASLASPNPLTFSVTEETVTPVSFRLKVPGDGTADMGFTVDSGGWMSGTLDLTTLEPASGGTMQTHLFDSLVGKRVPFTISWESATFDRYQDWYTGQKSLSVSATRASIQFGGEPSDVLSNRVAPSMADMPLYFGLTPDSSGNTVFNGLHVEGMSGERFALDFPPGAPFAGALDRDGYPVAAPFPLSSMVMLRRLDGSGNQTEAISGTVSGTVTPK